MSLFTAAETLPFGVAAFLMVGLAVVEGVGVMAAISPSQWLDNMVPEAPDGMTGALGWLHVGKVPMLVLLILFLLGFAIGGYAVQIFAQAVVSIYLPSFLAAIPAVFVGLSSVRAFGGLLAYIIPKDESSAVSQATLIGRAGVITTGTARAGKAAEVRVRDAHGNSHYLMVMPDEEGEEFAQGTAVLIVKKDGAIYRGIRNPHPELL